MRTVTNSPADAKPADSPAPAPGPTVAATYEAQLAGRVAELLPDLSAGERLELLGVMDPDDMSTSLAWIAAMYPQVFDFAIVRDRALAGRLTTRLAANARIAAGEALAAGTGPSGAAVTRSFPGIPESVSAARSWVAGFFPSAAAAADAALMTSELATNAILHSASGLPGGTFTVSVRAGDGSVRVDVIDQGEAPGRTAAPGLGKGLVIVGQLADESGADGPDRWFSLCTGRDAGRCTVTEDRQRFAGLEDQAADLGRQVAEQAARVEEVPDEARIVITVQDAIAGEIRHRTRAPRHLSVAGSAS